MTRIDVLALQGRLEPREHCSILFVNVLWLDDVDLTGVVANGPNDRRHGWQEVANTTYVNPCGGAGGVA